MHVQILAALLQNDFFCKISSFLYIYLISVIIFVVVVLVIVYLFLLCCTGLNFIVLFIFLL